VSLLSFKRQVLNSSIATSPITRKYVTIIRRFAPRTDLKICYHATYGACSPGTFASCRLDSSGQLDTIEYPQLCSSLHVKQNPAIVSVQPADKSQILRTQTVLESKSVPPWRHIITNSSVTISVGELLQLNVDAYDNNEDDDIDLGLTDDSVLPSSAWLGPRHCCSDDFTQCEMWPFQSHQQNNFNSTSCEIEVNDAAQSKVVSSCSVNCSSWAVRRPCRAGKSDVKTISSLNILYKYVA
jgi:hypothetical protein